jgi:vacuolar-type H+-ATPase subunit F/Vma7
VGRIVALGDPLQMEGFALAGCDVIAATAADDVRRAWDRLGPDVELVIVTPAAAQSLEEQLAEPGAPLFAVTAR